MPRTVFPALLVVLFQRALEVKRHALWLNRFRTARCLADRPRGFVSLREVLPPRGGGVHPDASKLLNTLQPFFKILSDRKVQVLHAFRGWGGYPLRGPIFLIKSIL